jgi:hypothetical protein
MSRWKPIALVASLAVALTSGGVVAWAQDHHHPSGGPVGHPAYHHGPGFHGHDFAHFTPAERAAWAGGAWHHEWHNGRFGWWWGVGGIWYFYPGPIYPYPDYVADIYYDPGMGVPPVAPAAGSAPGYWYYCQASGAYYPYVQSCPVPWTPVPPTPPSQ